MSPQDRNRVDLDSAMSSAFFGALSASLQEVDWVYIGRLGAAILPIWLFGAAVGFVVSPSSPSVFLFPFPTANP